MVASVLGLCIPELATRVSTRLCRSRLRASAGNDKSTLLSWVVPTGRAAGRGAGKTQLFPLPRPEVVHPIQMQIMNQALGVMSAMKTTMMLIDRPGPVKKMVIMTVETKQQPI